MNENLSIQINNLSKDFGKKKAINDVSLTIESGMFGLLGPNGAGKTTLMRIITSLVKPSDGEVLVCGVSTKENSKIRSMVGYLPQDFSMYGNMTAYEALDYLATLSGMSSAERKKLVPETLEKVNLLKDKKIKVKAMSGGMKRRLGIAQAIIHNPKILVVDEPTAGLDPEERVRFRNLLCEFAQERIVILSTHIVGDIEATCENIAIMDKGKLFYVGTVSEILDELSEKLYSVNISVDEVEAVKKKYLITSMKMCGKEMNVRIVSEDKPFPNAKKCVPDVEDAYLYKMNNAERGEENV